MELRHWILFALCGSAAGVATWIVCRLWYGRKIESILHRLHKSEKARQFAGQQTSQARKQLEALQKDLAEQNAAMAKAQIARQRSRHLEEVLKAEAAQAPDANGTDASARGFADTQPLR